MNVEQFGEPHAAKTGGALSSCIGTAVPWFWVACCGWGNRLTVPHWHRKKRAFAATEAAEPTALRGVNEPSSLGVCVRATHGGHHPPAAHIACTAPRSRANKQKQPRAEGRANAATNGQCGGSHMTTGGRIGLGGMREGH